MHSTTLKFPLFTEEKYVFLNILVFPKDQTYNEMQFSIRRVAHWMESQAINYEDVGPAALPGPHFPLLPSLIWWTKFQQLQRKVKNLMKIKHRWQI